MLIYTLPKKVSDLQPGDIVVSNGRALYLDQPVPAMRGTRVFNYIRYEGDDGAQVRSGVASEITFNTSATVPVVCVDIRDGAYFTPAGV